jgi:hypothetical protein
MIVAEIDGYKFYATKQGYPIGNVGKDIKRLHIYIWEKHYGKVPKGYHVHHKDGNMLNNDISNLELLPVKSHCRYHASKRDKEELAEMFINRAIPAAAKWHKSDAAKDWHRQHYEQCNREKWLAPITKICVVCGKAYTTVQSCNTRSRFCSNNCKTKFRNMSGVDDIMANCKFCGKQFRKNKYAQKQYCSRSCAKKARDLCNGKSGQHYAGGA